MANRRPQNGGRRMDFNRTDRSKNFGRSGVSPWQGGGPGGSLPNLLPLSGGSTEATLALASNIINLLQPRQNTVPSLLDMPIRRDFGPDLGRYDRGYGPNRMGNQGNFRRTGNYNRAGERINTNRKPFRPNDGQRQQNKSSPKKDDPKTKPVKESDEEVKQEKEGESSTKADKKEEETKKESPKTRYDDINSQFLKCHICNKSMWDGRSFENHLSGRAHSIMMQKTAESYALTADTMRQEFKIREMKRTRKCGMQPARDFYCAMCDMYAADGAIHRTTVGHRKLKKYLHPTCTCCHKEMPTRIELDEHRLTAEHLKNMQDKQEVVTKPKPEGKVMVISTLSMEQSYLREDRQRRPRSDERKEIKEKEDNAEENKAEEESMETDEITKESEDKKETENEVVDNENIILDYKEGDDLTNVTQNYPAYSTLRGVGRSFLSEFRCVQCRLCRKLLDSEETAEVHLRTWRHHQLFVRLLAEKSGRNTQDVKQDIQSEAPKRPHNSEESGNWKRRKTTPDIDEDNDDQHNGDVMIKEEQQEETTVEMPVNDELEDWEQSVDEILQDECVNVKQETNAEDKAENKEESPAVNEEKVEQPPEEKKQEEKRGNTPKSNTPSAPTPRGRGRGRGRGRRY